ncbi:hypothetical protein KDL29_05225 [bacterium]|nr:hypothetical protein [bacterium]
MSIRVAAIALFSIFLLASCGGGGTEQLTTGQISGQVSVVGPINGSVELFVGAFPSGSTNATQTSSAGRVSSTASLSGRTITYSFTELPFGSYYIGVFADAGGSPSFYYKSGDVNCTAQNQIVSGLSGQCSFSGDAPWGTVSGSTSITGDWPAAGKLTFIGISPMSAPQNVLQFLVSESDVNDGRIHYDIEGISYGTYLVGFYGYDPVSHQVDTFGAFDNPVVVSASSPNVATVNFASDFAGDPGTDPQLGTITGTVTLSSTLPGGLFYYVAANTIPPAQGAPPAVYEVFEDQLGGTSIDFTLSFLDDDEYSVSIFAYDITTHQATYFGEYDGTVTVSGGDSHSDIDFSADVSLLN